MFQASSPDSRWRSGSGPHLSVASLVTTPAVRASPSSSHLGADVPVDHHPGVTLDDAAGRHQSDVGHFRLGERDAGLKRRGAAGRRLRTLHRYHWFIQEKDSGRVAGSRLGAWRSIDAKLPDAHQTERCRLSKDTISQRKN